MRLQGYLGRKLRIAVLMGGSSSEREVSLVSGQMIAKALDPDRYDVTALDTRDLLKLSVIPPPALPSNGTVRPAEERLCARKIPHS